MTDELLPNPHEQAIAPGAQELVEQPREGTLAWLQTLEHVELDGFSLPRAHRIPEGAQLEAEEKRCAVVVNGQRCRARPTRLYGICIGHLGGGGTADMERMRARSVEARARLKTSRQLLSLGPARMADPRQLLRLRAHERAEELAEAMLAPLHDSDLGTLARQGAAKTVLDAAFPIQTVSLEVELPAEPDEVDGMGWSAMRQLAAQLLSPHPTLTPELEPAPAQGSRSTTSSAS